jgi:hypothetical protein
MWCGSACRRRQLSQPILQLIEIDRLGDEFRCPMLSSTVAAFVVTIDGTIILGGPENHSLISASSFRPFIPSMPGQSVLNPAQQVDHISPRSLPLSAKATILELFTTPAGARIIPADPSERVLVRLLEHLVEFILFIPVVIGTSVLTKAIPP